MTLVRLNTKYVHGAMADVGKARYGDGSIALLATGEDGTPLCKPTVCLTDYDEKPADGNVFVKDYGENEGMLKGLQDAGIIGDAIRSIGYGLGGIAYECPLIREIDEL